MTANLTPQMPDLPPGSWTLDADAFSGPPGFTVDRALTAIMREWRRFAVGFLIVTLCGAAYLILAPRQYTATAIVMTAPRQPDLARTDSVPGTNAHQSGPEQPDIEGELEIMSAPSSLRRVAQQLGLDTPAFINAGFSPSAAITSLAEHFGWRREATSAVIENLAERLGWRHPTAVVLHPERALITAADVIDRHLRVKSIGRSTLVEISYTAANPELAAKVANAVAHQYIDSRFQERVKTAERAAQYLKQRIASLSAESMRADQAVADFKAKAVIGGRDLPQLIAGMSALNGRLIAARADLDQAQSRLVASEAAVREKGPRAMLGMEAGPAAEQYLAQERAIAGLRRDAARLAVTAGTYNPQAKYIGKLATTLDHHLDEAGMIRLIGLRMKVSADTQDIAALERLIGAQRAQLDRLNNQQVRLNTLERDAAVSRSVFEDFVSRAKATEQVGFNDAQGWIVSKASIPLHHSKPNGIVTAIATLLAGVGVGCSAALLQDYKEGRKIRTLEDIDFYLRTRCLGLLPALRKRARNPRRQIELLASGANRVFAESAKSFYASLRTAMQQDPSGRPGGRVVMITSATPAEGKSSTTAILAATASAAGRRVIVVDCDLRAPALRAIFGAREGVDLATSVRDGLDAEQPVFRHRESGVWVLPAERTTHSPQSVLDAPGMAALLVSLRQKFDLILLDTPPLLTFSDARTLAPLADHVVLAVRWSSTFKQAARLAVRYLRDAGSRPTGTVLTRIDMKRFTALQPEIDVFRGYYPDNYKPPSIGHGGLLARSAR